MAKLQCSMAEAFSKEGSNNITFKKLALAYEERLKNKDSVLSNGSAIEAEQVLMSANSYYGISHETAELKKNVNELKTLTQNSGIPIITTQQRRVNDESQKAEETQ